MAYLKKLTDKPRKLPWRAQVRRKGQPVLVKISQDGNAEGCILVGLPDPTQAQFLRSVLGLRKLGVRSNKSTHNDGVSAA